jgi:phosphoribosyl 1,2-cyclic phosphodiesterase
LRFRSLGSGSEGNALLVEVVEGQSTSRVMVDCGFTLKEIERRLCAAEIEPASLSGIVVTHEHGDHVGGVFKLAKKHGVPMWMTYGTFAATQGVGSSAAGFVVAPDTSAFEGLHLIDDHSPFAIGGIELFPFPVPHDAREPVQYVFSDGDKRLGVLTDLGSSTPHVESMLGGCDALVLECNHDEATLQNGPYPPSLKNRVGGRFGHLSNGQAANILSAIDRSQLRHVAAAHLSKQNNTPQWARQALAGALGCEEDWVAVLSQEEGCGWRDV